MAGVGTDPILVDHGVGFVWWAIRESTSLVSFHATRGPSNGELYFFACSSG